MHVVVKIIIVVELGTCIYMSCMCIEITRVVRCVPWGVLEFVRKKRKEKLTPAFLWRREFEPVGLTLITVVRDAMYGFMPHVGGGLWGILVV